MKLYWTIHIIVFASILFELSGNLKLKQKVIILWCIFFTLFGGLRWQIGNDWDQYYMHFLHSNWSNIFNYDRYGNNADSLEPGFVFLNVLIKTIFSKFYWYNLIICGFVQFSYYKFSNEFLPQRPILMYVILMSTVVYFPVRAGLSVAILIWSYKYIRDRQLVPFFVVVLCASLIHYQCLIMLPMYWAGKIRPNFMTYTIVYFVISASALILIDYFTALSLVMGGDLGNKALNYSTNETENFGQGSTYMGILLHYFFLSVFFYIAKKGALKSEEWSYAAINIFFLYYSFYMTFSNGYGDLARLSDVYVAAKHILYITAVNYCLDNKNQILKIGAVLFFAAFYIYGFNNGLGGYYFEETSVPYKNIFDYNLELFDF